MNTLGIDKEHQYLELAFDGTRITLSRQSSGFEFAEQQRILDHEVRILPFYDSNTLCSMIYTDFTIVTNGYIYGSLNGKIYRSSLKYACVLGLNCYSCPGDVAALSPRGLAAVAEPAGLSNFLRLSGLFFLFGGLLGRFVCDWLCPFGLVQDLLHKIPIFKRKKRLPYHHIVKYGKYVVLISLLCIGSIFLFGEYAKVPAFCKCLCPLGAIYGWFNRFSLVQIHWEQERCASCLACERACLVALSLQEIFHSPECIRCGKCVDACPQKCLHFRGSGTKTIKG